MLGTEHSGLLNIVFRRDASPEVALIHTVARRHCSRSLGIRSKSLGVLKADWKAGRSI